MPQEPTNAGRSRNDASYRSRHRAASHDLAHTEAAQTVGDVPKHMPMPRGDAPLITTQKELGELIDHLRSAGSFAYDSEFIGEMTYTPKLCLIQVASRQRVGLLDPLAGLDLQPFWELICNASVEKIVHAGAQDVEPVIRHTGS